MRVAIFGGSFNPPHLGHLNSARYAAEQLRPDVFLIIPDHQPPHKSLEAGSPTPEELLKAADEIARGAKFTAELQNMKLSYERTF